MLDNNNTGKTIFRLMAILFLVYIAMPRFEVKQQELYAAEHGIGGGALTGDLVSMLTAETGYEVELAAFISQEAVLQEPVSLSRPSVLLFSSHIVSPGDNISTIAINHGLNQDSIISVNRIRNSRLLQAGRVLRIPNQDGILHNVRRGETLASIAGQFNVHPEDIKIANELFSDTVRPNTELFIPGARLDWASLQEINGDLFIWPVRGAITSPFGYRRDPFNPNRRQFHTGIDIRGARGTPVRAAMSGRVSRVGYNRVYGNYIIINHHSGFRTLYAHLNVIRTRTGAFVSAGERIGDVGSTGLSTGPHLHFTVWRNGVLVNPRPLLRN